MIRHVLLAALWAATLTASAATRVEMLAVVYANGQADPLLDSNTSSLSPGVFRRHLDAAMAQWRRCASPFVLDDKGRVYVIRLRPSSDEPFNEHQMLFRLAPSTKADRPRLAWCGPAKPSAAVTRKAREVDLDRLRAEPVDVLIQLALDEVRDPIESFGATWTTERMSADVVDGQYLIERLRVTFSGGDDRGYIFRVWDMPKREILWQRFGHPEWSSAASHVHEISAEMFFRLPGRKDLLMLGRYGKGWESTASAVYRLDNGTPQFISP